VIVVVELERGGAAAGMSGKILAVDQDNVRVSVVVIIDEGATRAHGFGQPFLAEGTVVVGEVNPGLGSDVAELDLGVGGGSQENRYQPRRHGGTEDPAKEGKAPFSVVP